mgnify:FL=1
MEHIRQFNGLYVPSFLYRKFNFGSHLTALFVSYLIMYCSLYSTDYVVYHECLFFSFFQDNRLRRHPDHHISHLGNN